MARNNKYEAEWGKGEADHITRSKYISGTATKNNLDKWAKYAKDASFDPSASRKQSKADLAPCGNHGREETYSDDWQLADRTDRGRGWADMKATTADNTYTGKGGSKRD